MNSEPHFISIMSASLTPTVAFFGIYIAFRQWKTNQNKLKYDLFDRRFSVYDAARNLIASILTFGKVKDEDLIKFLSGTREAKWLLDSDVADYLEKILYHKALELQLIETNMTDIGVEVERNLLIQRKTELKKWFSHQYNVLDTKFSPFLLLKH